jgi:hypothetical protein
MLALRMRFRFTSTVHRSHTRTDKAYLGGRIDIFIRSRNEFATFFKGLNLILRSA